MGFNNLDNTKIFYDFWDKYGQSLQHIDDIKVESSDDVSDINNPYDIDTSQVPMTIKRYNFQCSRFNFSQGEEFALIAHELGHANIKVNNIKFQDKQDEEYEADLYAIRLGLGFSLKKALKKICQNYIEDPFCKLFVYTNCKPKIEERINRMSNLCILLYFIKNLFVNFINIKQGGLKW